MRNTSSSISVLQVFSELKNKKHQIYVASRFVCYDKGVVFPHSAAFRQKKRGVADPLYNKVIRGIEEPLSFAAYCCFHCCFESDNNK